MFQSCKALVKTQIGNKIKYLKFDNGGQYTSSQSIKFCENHAKAQQYIMPYTHEQNGVLKWKNCILVETTHHMFTIAKLQYTFLVKGIAIAFYIQNHCYTSLIIDKTPFEL